MSVDLSLTLMSCALVHISVHTNSIITNCRYLLILLGETERSESVKKLYMLGWAEIRFSDVRKRFEFGKKQT